MRNITEVVCGSFMSHERKTQGNTKSTGNELILHGNTIAKWKGDQLLITSAGWHTTVTKERLNGLRGVNIQQKRGVWYLNGVEWDGEWINVYTMKHEPKPKESNAFGMLAAIMKIGEIENQDTTGRNDWKLRMLKAGIPEGALHMPEDWDTLSEEEKEKRLNGVIEIFSKG